MGEKYVEGEGLLTHTLNIHHCHTTRVNTYECTTPHQPTHYCEALKVGVL